MNDQDFDNSLIDNAARALLALNAEVTPCNINVLLDLQGISALPETVIAARLQQIVEGYDTISDEEMLAALYQSVLGHTIDLRDFEPF